MAYLRRGVLLGVRRQRQSLPRQCLDPNDTMKGNNINSSTSKGNINNNIMIIIIIIIESSSNDRNNVDSNKNKKKNRNSNKEGHLHKVVAKGLKECSNRRLIAS